MSDLFRQSVEALILKVEGEIERRLLAGEPVKSVAWYPPTWSDCGTVVLRAQVLP